MIRPFKMSVISYREIYSSFTSLRVSHRQIEYMTEDGIKLKSYIRNTWDCVDHVVSCVLNLMARPSPTKVKFVDIPLEEMTFVDMSSLSFIFKVHSCHEPYLI